MVDRNLLEGGTVAAEHHRVVEVNRQARGGFTMLIPQMCVKSAFVLVVCYANQENLTPMLRAKPHDCRRNAPASKDLLHTTYARRSTLDP